ncbi:MAG TPA: metallophosphoesterase family protein [Miltoncostaeaceae bacterium]|nr:metallophosphoesterase family protein [Miltoncostaeaceae bacterium]
MRIGVVADTHVGEHLPVLPPEVAEVLDGVDLILHAGDLTDAVVLEELGRIAPVVAVRGNHDDEAGIGGLPRDAVVEAGGRRIGLTHGARTKAVELPAAALSLLTARTVLLGFEGAMRRRFGDVDCVVVGHLHMPIHRMVDGALLFSPGAVFVPELDPGYSWSSLPARGYRRFRDRLPPAARIPGVGLIEAGPSGLTARVVPLTRPIRAAP